MIFTQKKSDLVDELFKSGVGFEAMPLDIVIEYAEADVKSCGEIYLDQLNDFSLDENASLKPILDLSNEMLLSLVSMERNGINVDRDALTRLNSNSKLRKTNSPSGSTKLLKPLWAILLSI